MNLVEEIRQGFAAMQSGGAVMINNMPDGCPAYIIRIPDGYGVAFPVPESLEVNEEFSSCKYNTGLLSLNGSPANYLMLCSAFEEYRNEFAAICADFAETDADGNKRKDIINDPWKWWEQWKNLVGNLTKNKSVAAVIAEMIVLLHVYSTDRTAIWTGVDKSSHDIECNDYSCEVKSTTKRYGAAITIAGQHQLLFNKTLFLYFCRMEKSAEGVSINDMQKKLVEAGYDPGRLELDIESLGFAHGSRARDEKFKILEKRRYVVDEKFPQITRESFKDNCIPSGIIHIEYTVDLDSIKYTVW